MEKWILAIAHASNIKQSWKAKHLLRGHPAWSIADKLPVLSESEVMHVEMFLESPKSMKQRFSSFFSCFFLSSAPARGRSKRRTSSPLRVSFLKTSQQRIIGRHASRSIFIFARSSRRKGSGSVREPSCLTQSFNWSSFSAGPSEGSTWSVVSHKSRTCHACVSCSSKIHADLNPPNPRDIDLSTLSLHGFWGRLHSEKGRQNPPRWTIMNVHCFDYCCSCRCSSETTSQEI